MQVELKEIAIDKQLKELPVDEIIDILTKLTISYVYNETNFHSLVFPYKFNTTTGNRIYFLCALSPETGRISFSIYDPDKNNNEDPFFQCKDGRGTIFEYPKTEEGLTKLNVLGINTIIENAEK